MVLESLNPWEIIHDTRICYHWIRASQKLYRESKNHKLLARYGKLVLKLMLVPAPQQAKPFCKKVLNCVGPTYHFAQKYLMPKCNGYYWPKSMTRLSMFDDHTKSGSTTVMCLIKMTLESSKHYARQYLIFKLCRGSLRFASQAYH